MSERLLILLIGLPGSGKSTLAQYLRAFLSPCRLISTDAIRAHLFGDEAVQGPWLRVQPEIQCQLQAAAMLVAQGKLQGAIYDATHAIRQHRREAVVLARQAGFSSIIGFWLDPPLDCCLDRNQQRDRRVPETVIRRMYHQLCSAPPTLADGFDCLIRKTDLLEIGVNKSGFLSAWVQLARSKTFTSGGLPAWNSLTDLSDGRG